MPATRGIRDLLLFFVFAGVPIVSFWLQDYPDTPFFSGMLVIFLVVLLWMRQYHKESEHSRLLDYDENLNFESFMWVGIGAIGVYIASSFIVNQYTSSVIWVPMHNVELGVGGFQISGFWSDILFQLVLVAAAEELCKLSLHLAFYMKLKESFSDFTSRAVSIAAPIAFWALLHVYAWQIYANMTFLLLSAFIAGLIIFWVMYKTKSVMAAILVHFAYNSLIIYKTMEAAP